MHDYFTLALIYNITLDIYWQKEGLLISMDFFWKSYCGFLTILNLGYGNDAYHLIKCFPTFLCECLPHKLYMNISHHLFITSKTLT